MELSEILAHFSIDPINGIIRWAKRPSNRVRVGDSAGYVNAQGYIVIKLRGVDYRAHRLIWSYCNGDISSCKEVDHKNVDKLDNRIENLRLTTHTENTYNVRITKRNTSGIKGVSWDKRRGKWEAYCDSNGKRKRLGRFNSLEDAAFAVRAYREQAHGEYANHG